MRTVNPILMKSFTVVAITLLSVIAARAEVTRTEIVATDDWPADSFLDLGTLRCAGGEVVWLNAVTPTCPGSGRLRLRNALGYSCIHSASADGVFEPRFTGVAFFSLSANFDDSHSGPVWGTWILVPSDNCDPQLLEDPDEFWEGTWQGKRAQVCIDDQCQWIGSLNYVGRGRGGSLAGQRFRGHETVVTFTPLPLPYELLGLCAPGAPCPPEGQMVGTIRKR